MRIAYLVAAPGIPVQGPSGASAHVRGLVRGLRERHEVRLVAARRVDHRGEYGQRLGGVVETGVPGWPSWLKGWRDLREVRTARRLAWTVIKDARVNPAPELVIERHSLFSDAAWRVGDTLGLPWILEVNAPASREREQFEQLRRPELARRWEGDVLRAAPVIVTVSTWLRDWLVREHGCRRVQVVANGTAAQPGDRARGRARLGLGSDEPAIGFLGSMKPWHGVGRLARVARALGTRLVLLGERRDPATFLVEGERLPEDTIWPGHLAGPELWDAVAALDVGLAPYPETAPPWFCPLKILDYRAQGVPVVASEVGECAGLVGEAGSVVPPEDDEALVEAVRSWLGRRTAPWRRTWSEVGEEMIAASRGS